MNRYLFYSLLALGGAFRVAMLFNYELVNGGEVDVYLADEGIVGLMGKHILEGRELPIFFYGQHYLGALEAYSAAALFSVLGVSVLSLRLVTFGFSLAVAAAVYRFTYKRYSVAAARWATALVAVAPMYFLQWNLKARGGFVEHIFLVFLVMLAFWRFYVDHHRGSASGFVLGLVTGLAIWVNQLVLAYVFLMGFLLFLDRSDRRGWVALCVGGLLGASLMIGYNVVHPLATFKTLGRKAMVLNRVPVEEREKNWVARGLEERVDAISQGVAKLGLVFGVPPYSDVERLGLSCAARAGGTFTEARRLVGWLPGLVFLAGLLATLPRRGRSGWERLGSDQLLGLFALVTFAVGYVSPRYMLAAYPLAAVMLGVLVSRLGGVPRQVLQAGALAVALFNTVSWADAMTLPSEEDERRGPELLAKLDELELRACYTAAPLYHLVFMSNEAVVLAPLQKDRYPKYNDVIEQSDRICYIVRDDQHEKRQHVALTAFLEERGVVYQEARSAPYSILHGFEPRRVITAAEVDRLRYQETVRVSLTDILKAGAGAGEGE